MIFFQAYSDIKNIFKKMDNKSTILKLKNLAQNQNKKPSLKSEGIINIKFSTFLKLFLSKIIFLM